MIRIQLPTHLRALARITDGPEISLDLRAPITVHTILTAIEARYPVLKGTLRDHSTLQRRPMIRFYACNEDLSLDDPNTPLPERITSGQEPFYIVAAIAGG